MKNNKNKQLLFGIIGIAILVMAVVGVTYAFFSYTRTGNTNTVQAGRIVFNSTQGDAINLSNAFPITSAQALTDTTNAKTLQITVSGDTSYSRGLEYLVTATDVHMTTTTGKTVPVTIEVSVTGNNSKTLGTSNNDYYTNRGGNTSMYNVEYDGSLDENNHILIGYIAPDNNQTGVDGIINIKTYFNDADILITDTPDTVDTAGKTVLSTTEWNSLKENNALSFKIKVEAREGTWVEEQTTPENCFTISGNAITGYDANCGGNNVVIPKSISGNNITEISSAAFVGYPLSNDKKITRVVIPDGVSTIGVNAFAGNKIKNLVIPDSVISIENYAFSSNQIETLILGNGLTSIGNQAFQANKINSLILPVRLTNIGEQAFLGNYLTSITIPGNVTSIGKNSFKFNNLQTIIINNGVQSIASGAFGVDGSNYSNNGISYGQNEINNVTLPNSITSWYCDAFTDTVTITNNSNVECTN